MLYRTVLGMTLQALQQLTGANFFFYYGKFSFTNLVAVIRCRRCQTQDGSEIGVIESRVFFQC